MRTFARTLQLLVGIVIGLIWIQSATAHADNPFFFLSSVYKYKLVGPAIGRFVAVVLPSLEFVLAICLLFRIFVGGALLTSACLLTMFACVQVLAFSRGLKIDCGCFGPASSRPIDLGSIASVVTLAACVYLALACFVYVSRRGQSEGAPDVHSKEDLGMSKCITLPLFLFFSLQASSLPASEIAENDRRWADARATATVPANVILKHYWSLCLGDRLAIQSFRSLFSERTFECAGEEGDNKRIRYLLFVPDTRTPLDKRPLVIWLHGGGDGEADELHHLTGLARLFLAPPWQRDRYPFFVLSVLAPGDSVFWTGSPSSQYDMLDVVAMILDKTVDEFPVDTTRISVVGASRGGAGCWEIAMRFPHRFSAIAPISSRGGDLSRIGRLKTIPVWAFQSTYDKLPIDAVRQTVGAVQGVGGVAHLTEFDSDAHDAWTPAFDNYELLNWLLTQQRGQVAASPPGTIPRNQRMGKLANIMSNIADQWIYWLTFFLASVLLSLFLVRRLDITHRSQLMHNAK
jgi:pimeloyl-ACP methyl ester carboxylesterase